LTVVPGADNMVTIGLDSGPSPAGGAKLETIDSRRFREYADAAPFCRRPPHLWVTASP
jgi:hypothetical protein